MTDDRSQDSEAVLEALRSRRSIRGFRDTPIPREVVERLLSAAARAPSANNTQPWRAYVLTGAVKARLSEAILEARAGAATDPAPEYAYYPASWPEPYLSRRRAVGWQLYALLGIGKGDREAARAWHDRNFAFFGAPVGMIFTMDRRLGLGGYIDLGMFMQGIMTGARGLGLDTCAQAAFASYHAVIRTVLGLAAEELVVCGMALGHADDEAPANRLHAERADLSEFVVFPDA